MNYYPQQTPEERRAKYKMAKKRGLPTGAARRIRDFRKAKFVLYKRSYKEVVKAQQ